MTDVVVVGSYVQDLAFNTSAFPAPGETRIGQFKTGPGGKGFNQAVACHRQGVETLFVGAVGSDLFADALRDFLASEKLEAMLQVCDDVSSGAASIVVNADAENLIVVALGANDLLSSDFVRAHADAIGGAGVLVCQAENNLPATAEAMTVARASGTTTVLNPAPINPALDRDLLALADIIVPNETEFAFLMEHLFDTPLAEDYWTAADEDIDTLCRKTGNHTVILTLGDKGCFVSRPDEHYRVPAASVSPVDTTGAGDAFNGGLASGLLKFSDDFRQAVAHANVVAGLSTQKPGTAPAMPTSADVAAHGG